MSDNLEEKTDETAEAVENEAAKEASVAEANSVSEPSVNKASKKTKKESRTPIFVMGAVMSAMMVALIVLLCLTLDMAKANSKSIDELRQKESTETKDETAEKLEALTKEVETLNSTLTSLIAKGEDVAQEDDVNIAGGYKILSTKEISDAYLSGDLSKLTDDQKKCAELADAVLKEIITDDMTDYEKELAVFIWIRDNIKHDDGVTVLIPDPTKSVDTPLGVLTNKKAVCVGYATTNRLLLNMLGIECKVVHDTSLVHSWNEVKLDDGWYMTDIYSNAESRSFSNFNMNYGLAASSHSWNEEFFPTLDGVKYTYARMTAEKFTSYADLAQAYRDLMESNKSGEVYTLFTGKDAKQKAVAAQYEAERAGEYFNMTELSYKGYVEANIVIAGEDEYIVSFTIELYGEEDPSEPAVDLDPEIMEEIDSELEKAFENFFEKYDVYQDDYDYEGFIPNAKG